MERGQLQLNDEHDERLDKNEEMLYSGVIRRDFKKFSRFNTKLNPDFTLSKMTENFINSV